MKAMHLIYFLFFYFYFINYEPSKIQMIEILMKKNKVAVMWFSSNFKKYFSWTNKVFHSNYKILKKMMFLVQLKNFLSQVKYLILVPNFYTMLYSNKKNPYRILSSNRFVHHVVK